MSVFLPERLELLKGPPAVRRAHLDQFVAALWPARAETRRATRASWRSATRCWRGSARGRASRGAMATWDRELATAALALRADRAQAVALLAEPFAAARATARPRRHGALEYRPRSHAAGATSSSRS